MTTASTKLTVQEFADYAASRKGVARCELINGEVHEMSPAGFEHGKVVYRLGFLIGQHVVANSMGIMLGAETGFSIESLGQTVLAPDVAFVHKSRAAEAASRKFCPIAPDFCAEVLSPSDRVGDVNEKINAWLAAGVGLVWVVDPDRRTLTAFTPGGDFTVHREADIVHGGDVLPGLELHVKKLFE